MIRLRASHYPLDASHAWPVAMAWSGAYLLFALVYGKYLLRASLDED
jgi:hypothetical protein